MERLDRYRIGKEQVAGFIFAFVYFGAALLFGELKVGLIIFSAFAVTVVLARSGVEWPLTIYVRVVHLVFIALIALSKMSVIKL